MVLDCVGSLTGIDDDHRHCPSYNCPHSEGQEKGSNDDRVEYLFQNDLDAAAGAEFGDSSKPICHEASPTSIERARIERSLFRSKNLEDEFFVNVSFDNAPSLQANACSVAVVHSCKAERADEEDTGRKEGSALAEKEMGRASVISFKAAEKVPTFVSSDAGDYTPDRQGIAKRGTNDPNVCIEQAEVSCRGLFLDDTLVATVFQRNDDHDRTLSVDGNAQHLRFPSQTIECDNSSEIYFQEAGLGTNVELSQIQEHFDELGRNKNEFEALSLRNRRCCETLETNGGMFGCMLPAGHSGEHELPSSRKRARSETKRFEVPSSRIPQMLKKNRPAMENLQIASSEDTAHLEAISVEGLTYGGANATFENAAVGNAVQLVTNSKRYVTQMQRVVPPSVGRAAATFHSQTTDQLAAPAPFPAALGDPALKSVATSSSGPLGTHKMEKKTSLCKKIKNFTSSGRVTQKQTTRRVARKQERSLTCNTRGSSPTSRSNNDEDICIEVPTAPCRSSKPGEYCRAMHELSSSPKRAVNSFAILVPFSLSV